MNRKHTLQLFLGVRLQAPSTDEISRLAEQVLEMIRSVGRPIPLHWNFPVSLLLGKNSRSSESVIKEIRSRMGSRGDRILPAGFSGSVHSHLLLSELERELVWCYKNPWFPALKEVFGIAAETILPFYPDILREAAAGVYSRRGFRFVGLPMLASGRSGRIIAGSRSPLPLPFRAAARETAGSPSRAWIQPVFVLPTGPGEEQFEWLKSLHFQDFAGSRPFFLFDCAAQEARAAGRLRDTVLRLLEHLARGREPEPLSFEPSTFRDIAGGEPSGVSAASPGELLAMGQKAENPFRRRLWESVTRLRAPKKKTNSQIRTLLALMTAPSPGGRTVPPPAAAADLDITNVSMIGSVTLVGSTLQATFVEGRLVNLQQHGCGILAGAPATSYLTMDNRRITLQAQSAFAFEREASSCLRADFSAQPPHCRKPLRVVADYCFRDGEHGLSVDLFVSYPSFPEQARLTEIAPLEIVLVSFAGNDSVSLEAQFPDGVSYTEALQPRDSVRLLYGCRFLIRKNGKLVSLSSGTEESSLVQALEFRVRRHRRRHLLAVNLFGSYSPRAERYYSGLEERLSFTIGCEAR